MARKFPGLFYFKENQFAFAQKSSIFNRYHQLTLGKLHPQNQTNRSVPRTHPFYRLLFLPYANRAGVQGGSGAVAGCMDGNVVGDRSYAHSRNSPAANGYLSPFLRQQREGSCPSLR